MADFEPTDLDSWALRRQWTAFDHQWKDGCLCALTSHKKDNELWNLSLVLGIVSAACFSLGLLLLGWQGGLSALLQHSDRAQTFFFFWMLHGSTKVVVRAVALLSAKTKDKVAMSLGKLKYFLKSNN